MEFQQYLRHAGSLYYEAAISDFHPDLLRRFGGSLKLAGDNAIHVRFDPDSVLGMQRRTQDRWTAARIGWRRHADQIERRLHSGETPTQAIYNHMRAHGTHPHRPSQLQPMLQRQAYEGGECSAWMLPTIMLRQRIARGANIMTDTFGALTTMTALVITANDWQNATPEEWDTALNAGEVGVVVGQMAGAHADARAGNTAGFDRHEGLD